MLRTVDISCFFAGLELGYACMSCAVYRLPSVLFFPITLSYIGALKRFHQLSWTPFPYSDTSIFLLSLFVIPNSDMGVSTCIFLDFILK